VSLLGTWRRLLGHRPVVALMVTGFLLMAANEMPFIVYGAWLESSFGLSLGTLGLASISIGLAEAVAEMIMALVTDRLGKRRSALIGIVGLAASLVLLPWLSSFGLVPALAGMVLMAFSFEFGIISLLPLLTEVVPEARASTLSVSSTAVNLGRILGAVAGGWLWHWESIAIHAYIGAGCALLGAIFLFWGVPEIGTSSVRSERAWEG
jgi:predicted MFS family arabinose efflux permease